MAGAPDLQVYNNGGTYVAACKEPEAAVLLADFYEGFVCSRHDKARSLYNGSHQEDPTDPRHINSATEAMRAAYATHYKWRPSW